VQGVDVQHRLPLWILGAVGGHGGAPPDAALMVGVPPEVVQMVAGLAHAGDLRIGVQDREDLLTDAGEPVAGGQFGGAFAVAGAYPVQGGVALDVLEPAIGVFVGHHMSSLSVASLSLRGLVWRERTWG